MNQPISQSKLTKEKIKYHFRMNFWKYLVCIFTVAVACHLAVLAFTPKPDPEKVLDIYYAGPAEEYDKLYDFADELKAAFPQYEEVNVGIIMYASEDDFRGQLQGSVYFASGQGDFFICCQDFFNNFSVSGGTHIWKSLDEPLADGSLTLPEGTNLDLGHVGADDILKMGVALEDATDEQKAATESDSLELIMGKAKLDDVVRGIPLDSLTKLDEHAGVQGEGLVVTIPYYGEQDEGVYEVIEYLFDNYR